jgi:copper chaperone CopZ
MFRVLIIAASAAVVAGCSQPVGEPAGQLTAASFNTAGAPTVVFSVPDMMCPEGCAVEVKEILAKQPGAKDVLVDFEGKTATVAIDEAEFDSAQALAALIDKQFTKSSLREGGAEKPAAGESVVH